MQLTLPTDSLEREHALRSAFSQQEEWNLRDCHHSLNEAWRGGRSQGLIKLQAVDAKRYSHTRNFTHGAVTHLSPYLRHGCLTLAETVDYVTQQFGEDAEKLVFELAWRDYWQQVWRVQGDAIFSPLNSPVVVLGDRAVPKDVINANTGLPCMDSFIYQLAETGYLHNHARMWLASYLVHWRKVDWKQAADWMVMQLLDGDFASNHLSWQWVASTFSQKPYYFNQENLAKYTQNTHCADCTARCVFRKSYEDLATDLFEPNPQREIPVSKPTPNGRSRRCEWSSVSVAETQLASHDHVIWVHDEMLSPNHPLLQRDVPACFIFDPDYFAGWSFKRLVFIADALAEMPSVKVYLGNTHAILSKFKQPILTQATHNRQLWRCTQTLNIQSIPGQSLSPHRLAEQDLRSFTRYWKQVAPLVAPNNKKNHTAKSNSLYCR